MIDFIRGRLFAWLLHAFEATTFFLTLNNHGLGVSVSACAAFAWFNLRQDVDETKRGKR